MLHFFKTTCFAAVCALLLAVPASAQQAPAHKPLADHYYLNGQPSTKKAVEQLQKRAPRSIASVNVLKGKQAVDYTHDPRSRGAVLVTTKARQ